MLNILFWHGYNLSGSGSNVFALNISRELATKNNVFLMCQENDFKNFEAIKEVEFLDEYTNTKQLKLLHFNDYNLSAIKPYVGDVLPVFVLDSYENFLVKSFLDLSDSELENYIDLNVNAVKTTIKKYSIDLIICNHLVISPHIMSLATKETKVPFIVVGHGSSLNYIIANSQKYLELSFDGLKNANRIILQSEYFHQRTLEIYKSVDTQDIISNKIKIIPSGVNTDVFYNILSKSEFKELIHQKTSSSLGFYESLRKNIISYSSTNPTIKDLNSYIDDKTKYIDYKDLDRDLLNYIDFFEKNNTTTDNEVIISFVGKLIISKGVQVFLMSLPYIFSKYPNSKIIIIGFGKFRMALEILINALISGNISLLDSLANEGSFLEDNTTQEPLKYVKTFLEQLNSNYILDYYISLAKKIPLDNILFTGNMNHDLLPYVLQKSDITVIPSIFPESFGMVAIEAMSCGSIPIGFNHSGLKDIIPLKAHLVDLNSYAVNNLAEKLIFAIDSLISKDNLKEFYYNYSKRFSFKNISEEILDSSKHFINSKIFS